MKNSGIVPKKL